MKLLSLFEEQIKLLVDEGRPSLSRFLDSLASENIALPSEVSAIGIQLGLESDAIPSESVAAQVGHLARAVRQWLSQLDLEDTSFMVHDAVDLSVDSLDRLCPDEWLDMWVIATAMELADKPPWVRYGVSIPLDEERKDDRTIPITKPFGLWRKKVNKYRSEVEHNARLGYFCPLNLGTNHFTLLEINEHQRTIYHYNSMATSGVIYGKTRSTRVRRTVEAEFGDLGFKYEEAPCPQQKDSSSCGLMVIRNATLRMNGQPVGDWGDKVNPERLRQELVDLFMTALRNNGLQPKARRSKRKLADQS